jgi:acetyl esterase/lipase
LVPSLMVDGGGVLTFAYADPFAAAGLSAGLDILDGLPINYALSEPKIPMWKIHGTSDQVVPFGDDRTFAYTLQDAGWPVTFTPVPGAPHDWFWQASYGYTMEDLWGYLSAYGRDAGVSTESSCVPTFLGSCRTLPCCPGYDCNPNFQCVHSD